MNTTTVGLIVVPLAISMLGAAYAGIRGAIRFAQYLVRSEEAQESASEALKSIASRLDEYMAKTDGEVRGLDRRMIAVELELNTKRSAHRGE